MAVSLKYPEVVSMASPVLGRALGSDLTKHLVKVDQNSKSIPSVIALEGGSLNCTTLPWESQEPGRLSYRPAYGAAAWFVLLCSEAAPGSSGIQPSGGAAIVLPRLSDPAHWAEWDFTCNIHRFADLGLRFSCWCFFKAD